MGDLRPVQHPRVGRSHHRPDRLCPHRRPGPQACARPEKQHRRLADSPGLGHRVSCPACRRPSVAVPVAPFGRRDAALPVLTWTPDSLRWIGCTRRRRWGSGARRRAHAAYGLMMLWTGRTSGGPASSMPSFWRIGISRWPNASNFACDSQISLTRNTPSASKATWYCMPSGGHCPDASIFGMTSSYFFAFMPGAEVKRAKMLMSISPDPELRAPYPLAGAPRMACLADERRLGVVLVCL